MGAILLAYNEGLVNKKCGVSTRLINRYIQAAVKHLGIDLGKHKLVLFSFVITYRINRSEFKPGDKIEKLEVPHI